MVKQLLYKFLLNGIDITEYVLRNTKISIDKLNSSGNSADVILGLNISNLMTPEAGHDIIISRGVLSSTEDVRFRGKVKSVSWGEDGVGLSCRDKLQELKYSLFKKSYDKNIDASAGKVSEIFKSIVEDYGFTVSVVDSGSDILLTKFISRNNNRLERLSVLAKIMNWQYYYDYNNDWVRFEPPGYITYGTNLIVGQNIFNIPLWNEDIERVVNKLTVEGAYEYDTRVNNFTGDGGTQTFTLSYTPEATDVTIAGVLKVRGVAGQTNAYDYLIDKQQKTITFTVAPAGAAAIVVTYQTIIPAPVTSIAPDSIARYGVTQEDTYKFDDIVNIEDAESRLNNLLTILKEADISTDIITDEYNIQQGMYVNIADSNRPEMNGNYIVRMHTINYGDAYDSVKIGTYNLDINELFYSIDERLRALENTNTTSEELLRQILNMTRYYLAERRYTILQRNDLTSFTGVVFDNIINGGFDDVNHGFDGTGDVTTNDRITQYNNTYKEFVYDTDFKDATSTGTWDTTTKTITLTEGQFVLTSCISKGPAYSFFTASNGSISGTYAFEISADGKSNWQTIVPNIRTNFITSTSSGVYTKITNTATGGVWGVWGTWGTAIPNVVIQNTYYADGSYSEPAIKIILEE